MPYRGCASGTISPLCRYGSLLALPSSVREQRHKRRGPTGSQRATSHSPPHPQRCWFSTIFLHQLPEQHQSQTHHAEDGDRYTILVLSLSGWSLVRLGAVQRANGASSYTKGFLSPGSSNYPVEVSRFCSFSHASA